MTLLIAVLLGPPPAPAGYRVGVSEQSAGMFDTVAWRLLELERVRYLVPWDWLATGQAEVDAFMRAAQAHGQDVLVTFTARRGCFDGRRYSRARVCRAPSARAYRRAVLAFDDRYPWVRAYSAWNEVNHISQPTFAQPRLAVRYHRVLHRERRRRDFRVLAADVLDTANMHRYLRAFLRRAPGRPRLWGLHNYQDVNARTSADTRRMLEIVPGEVWLTETNGIVKFGDTTQFRYSEARAARRTRWMFALADRYSTRRRGLRSRITRLYIYKWFGEAPGARFDAGLVAQDGAPRPAYFVVAQRLARPAAHRPRIQEAVKSVHPTARNPRCESKKSRSHACSRAGPTSPRSTPRTVALLPLTTPMIDRLVTNRCRSAPVGYIVTAPPPESGVSGAAASDIGDSRPIARAPIAVRAEP